MKTVTFSSRWSYLYHGWRRVKGLSLWLRSV